MSKRTYRPSARLLADQAARRRRDREEAQDRHDREYTYWREPDGRMVSFSSQWSREAIRDYKANVRARYGVTQGSTRATIPSSRRNHGWMIDIAMAVIIALAMAVIIALALTLVTHH